MKIRSGQRTLSQNTLDRLFDGLGRAMPFTHPLLLIGVDKDDGGLVMMGSANMPEELGVELLRVIAHTLEEWS